MCELIDGINACNIHILADSTYQTFLLVAPATGTLITMTEEFLAIRDDSSVNTVQKINVNKLELA